jgi:pimeloyl-ACP methyl ester carboxylesterase
LPVISLDAFRCNYVQLPAEASSSALVHPMVMVHGLATNLAFWYAAAPNFTSTTPVTLWDLRGHGRSTMPSEGYTPLQMAVDLHILLDRLEIATAMLVGHSFGGAVVTQFALHYPERVQQLILADVRLKAFQPHQNVQAWPHWPALEPLLRQVGITIEPDEPEAGYRLLTEMARLQVQDPETLAKTTQLSAEVGFIGSKRMAEQWLKLLESTTAKRDLMSPDPMTGEQLQQLCKPTLLIYGDRSPTLPTAHALHKLWPHAAFELVPNAGHFFPLSQPQFFSETASRFLQTLV